jgi:phytoene/squalene synthetase
MNEEFLTIFSKIDFARLTEHPNILIAAAFWDEERYKAAKICYKYMRVIDDLIDNHKSVHNIITETEKIQFMNNVRTWISITHDSDNNHTNNAELSETIKRFHIPLWAFEEFAKSMIYDINHNGFKTLDDFFKYSQGASVAPASIFVHLSGLKAMNGEFGLPEFNVKTAATSCALFSYIVHIIRDFQKDQQNNLNYFAEELMNKYGLTFIELKKIAHGNSIPSGFRNMIQEYYDLAAQYRRQTVKVIQDIGPGLGARYRLSLEIIFNLYLMVFERINIKTGKFTTAELNPSPDETKKRVYDTIVEFG